MKPTERQSYKSSCKITVTPPNSQIPNTMTEETLETILLGHIAKELKDEIVIGRQVRLAKTIIQALRIHDVVGRSEQLKPIDGEALEALNLAIEKSGRKETELHNRL